VAKTVAISFEEDHIKIVRAYVKRRDVVIERAEVISKDEFDSYIKKEKTAEFIITYHFRDSYHGILTVPVVKPKYLKKIIESEIRRTTPLRNFSFIYTPIGERIIENKRVMEIFYFAVQNEEIRNVVERFYREGKTVKAIYPEAFPALSLLDSENSTEPVMGVIGTGKERIVFLIKQRVIYFIRRFESLDAELSEFDIQNITMTVNYCFQNLRINPSVIFLGGRLSKSLHDITTLPPVPLACLYKPGYIHCSEDVFNEFIIPIASLSTPKSSNILSKEFRNLQVLKNYMVTTSKVFIILSILCLGLIFLDIKNISDKREVINSAIRDRGEIEKIFSKYSIKEIEMRKYMPVVKFLSKSVPSIQKLFLKLAEIDTEGLKFTSIEAKAIEDNSFGILIQGRSTADTYTAMETSYSRVIQSLDKIEDLEIVNKTIDLGNKTFKIEMRYKGI